MNTLFRSFCNLIHSVPDKGIGRTIEVEGQMLEADLSQKRTLSPQEARSILAFRHFLQAAKLGNNIFPVSLPPNHIVQYREIVERMIEARELPVTAKDQFDRAFSAGFMKAIAE
jgi:hypothetical protein